MSQVFTHCGFCGKLVLADLAKHILTHRDDLPRAAPTILTKVSVESSIASSTSSPSDSLHSGVFFGNMTFPMIDSTESSSWIENYDNDSDNDSDNDNDNDSDNDNDNDSDNDNDNDSNDIDPDPDKRFFFNDDSDASVSSSSPSSSSDSPKLPTTVETLKAAAREAEKEARLAFRKASLFSCAQ